MSESKQNKMNIEEGNHSSSSSHFENISENQLPNEVIEIAKLLAQVAVEEYVSSILENQDNFNN